MRGKPTDRFRKALCGLCAGLCAGLAVAATPAAGQALISGPGFGGAAPGGPSTNPGASLVAPGGGVAPPATIQSPLNIPPSAAPPPQAAPSLPAVPGAQVALYLAARFGSDLGYIQNGLIWRIYSDRPDVHGAYRMIREERTSAPAFVLPPGGYVVHVTFGQASASKHIALRADTVREIFTVPAGGLRFEGKVGDVRIPAGQISFDVFKGSQFEVGDKRPMVQGAMTGDVVLVPEGTYTIVSNYGDGNAVVRSDIRVQPGKLTDVTVVHRAAVITLKLVATQNGEALANTAWSVLTPGGDVIKESIGAFPRVILAEGEYRAIARNDGKVFERDFRVVTGVDSEIAVLAR